MCRRSTTTPINSNYNVVFPALPYLDACEAPFTVFYKLEHNFFSDPQNLRSSPGDRRLFCIPSTMSASGVSTALHRGFDVQLPDSQRLRHGHMKCDFLGSRSNGVNGALLVAEKARVRIPRSDVSKLLVAAKIRKGKKTAETEYPWPDKLSGNIKEGYLSYLSRFKPLPTRPKPFTLPFETPVVELEKKIAEVRDLANSTGMDFSEQISELEKKYEQVLKDLYAHLTPIQRLSVARHPNRPTYLDHVLNITDKWVELHGDRAGYDDPAIVTGIGSIDGISFMFIGHQKGRNTKENIYRNFAMPTPHGYRKALRMMKHADHHGFPIISFIDTPGAYADIKSEEIGQGEAIAQNLRTMFSLKVPIVTVVIGEGGSGGALAIGCCNKMLMLDNSVYYVASPEACAAILWKTSSAAPLAAESLKITAQELHKLKIADEVIPEPLGGAHTDPFETSKRIKDAVMKHMHELLDMETSAMMQHRIAKFRALGSWQEGVEIDPYKKRNMKKRDAPISEAANATVSPQQLPDPRVKEKSENFKKGDMKVETRQPSDTNVKDKTESLQSSNAKAEKPDDLQRGSAEAEKIDESLRSTVNVNTSARY